MDVGGARVGKGPAVAGVPASGIIVLTWAVMTIGVDTPPLLSGMIGAQAAMSTARVIKVICFFISASF